MKRWKRCAAALLCVCLMLPAVTAHAATEAAVRVKRLSGDLGRGYYVVFEMNGHEYRSDLCGEAMNYGLWLRCSDKDKKDIMENYAFYPKARIAQFGYANSKKMCDWVDADTGWKQARDVLADRLMKRDFSRLQYFYEGDGSDYESRSSIGKNDSSFKQYDYLGEVRDYLQIKNNMKELYDMGTNAYYRLRDAKSYQTSIATMSTCGDLISFITERAMVPSVTPGGMSALMPSVKGELQGLLDKCSGFSETVTNAVTGKKLDAATAREIIDQYWVTIEVHQSMAEYCVDKFMELKAKKSAAYDAAMQVIQDEKDRAAGNLNEALGDAGDLAMAEYTPTSESGTWDELAAQYDIVYDQWDDWRITTFGDQDGSVKNYYSTKLSKIKRTFDAWPVLERDGGFGPLKYDLDDQSTYGIRTYYMPDGRFTVWNLSVYSASGESWSHFSKLRTLLPEALKGCEADIDKVINALDSYVDEYTTAVEGIQAAWLAYESTLTGLWDAMWATPKTAEDTYVRRHNALPGSMKSDFEYLYRSCAQVQGLTLDDYKKQLEAQKKYYENVGKLFEEDCAAYEAELRIEANKYQAVQKRLADCHTRWLEAYNAHKALVEETEAIYYTKDRKKNGAPLVSDDLDQLFQRAEREGRLALLAEWGADLSERLDRLDAYRLKAEKIKEERDLCLKDLPGSRILVLLNETVGGGLRSRTELENDWNDLYPYDKSWASEEYVRQACAEFTNGCRMNYLIDTSLEEADWLKFNYLRGDDAAKSTASSRIYSMASEITQGRGSGGALYEKIYPYSYQTLAYPARNQLYGELNAWGAEAASYRPVTGLRGPASLMDDSAHAMAPGGVWDLGALVSVLPVDASYQTLVWDTSNSDVCTVDENGRVTAVDSGTAAISVRALDSTRTVTKTETGEEVVTFDPEPLTFAIQVGTGTPAGELRVGDVIWKNYGTEESPKYYLAFDNGDGTTSVTCALRKDTYEPMDIAAALYDGATGQMLGLSYFSRERDAGYHVFSKTVPNENGLRLKVFSLSSDGGFLPLGEPLLDALIPAAGG